MINQIKNELKKYASPEKAKILQKFFKTGPGEYGEGDIFIGVKVPEQRIVAKKFADTPLDDIGRLLSEKVHEYRLTGLIILVNKFQILNSKLQTEKEAQESQMEIVQFYLNNLKGVNNWDLVDLSAPYILGGWLVQISNIKFQISKKSQNTKATKNNPYTNNIAKKMARSDSMWERRIAMMSTFGLIKNNEFGLAFDIAEILLRDEHDLIHKVVGWMLREIGKRNTDAEEIFLKKYYNKMPRTMLRYAIERFEEGRRQAYLKEKI